MINILDEMSTIQNEITLYHKGEEACSKSYAFGPFIRDHYLIHFVSQGKGRFTTRGKSYEICDNQAFVIFPGIETYYQADGDKPWTYLWVGFSGDMVERLLSEAGITIDNPVLDLDRKIWNYVEKIVELPDSYKSFALKGRGYLFMLLDAIDERKKSEGLNLYSRGDYYIRGVEAYIKANYSGDISVQAIADFLSLDRSHLSRLFKKNTGISIQTYLISFRVESAKELLDASDLKVASIGANVGYTDPYYFNRIFKRITGYTPSAYRKRHIRG